MEEIDALIQRRMGESVLRLQATIAEEQSLRGPEHKLDHNIIESLISDSVRAEMAAICAERPTVINK